MKICTVPAFALLALIVAAMASPVLTRAAEDFGDGSKVRGIKVQDLPEAVTKAIQAKYPDGRLATGRIKTTREGTDFYVVEVVRPGDDVEVTAKEDGTIVSTEVIPDHE